MPGVNGDSLISRNRLGLVYGSLIAVTLGLLLGVALGLLVTWVFWPVEFKNADLADLRPSLKEDYVRMIAVAYEADGDAATATQRLAPLGLDKPPQTFSALIEREKNNSDDSLTRDALIHLSQALGYQLSYTAQRPTPGPSSTPTSTPAPETPVVNIPVFGLIDHAQLTCADEVDGPLLKFYVRDAIGRDLPNIGIEIKSDDVVETIYTGLKPERGLGYADYAAAPGTYSATVLNARSETISNLVVGLAPENCQADKGATPRGWKIVFQQKKSE
jgi:hypothetical protein